MIFTKDKPNKIISYIKENLKEMQHFGKVKEDMKTLLLILLM